VGGKRTPEQRANISASKKGKKLSKQHVANLRIASAKRWAKKSEHDKASKNTTIAWKVNGENLRAAHVGVPRSKKTKRKISKKKTGVPWSVTRRAVEDVKQPQVIRRQREREEKLLLQSGYGHSWRLKDLDKSTREAIG
jgi:hypothetical protein